MGGVRVWGGGVGRGYLKQGHCVISFDLENGTIQCFHALRKVLTRLALNSQEA